jgi:hypothetical protein
VRLRQRRFRECGHLLDYGFWREPRDPNMRRRRLGLGQRRIDDGVHFLLLSTLHKLLLRFAKLAKSSWSSRNDCAIAFSDADGCA